MLPYTIIAPMAKKKRKHFIKLNNKVRELFGNLPFDEGITTLSDDELLELVLLLDLEVTALDREENIRALRRVWSEGDYHYRRAIIQHLTGKKPLAPPSSTAPRAIQSIDKVDKILTLLAHFEHSREEEQAILESFMELRPVKITSEKIENKLTYIRLQKRITQIEEALEITLNTHGEIEFYYGYQFDFTHESFTKMLLTRSAVLDIPMLLKKDNEAIIQELQTHKETLIAEKSDEIRSFVHSLAHNRYMSEEVACTQLRRLPVECDLTHAPVETVLLEQHIKEINPSYYLIESSDHFIVEKSKTLLLFDTEIPYRLSVSYAKPYLYSCLWRDEALPIAEDMTKQKETLTARFWATVDILKEELVALSVGLEVETSTIERFIRQFLEPQLISSGNLKIKEKSRKRILYHFGEYLKPRKEKHMREELLANTIRDFKRLFPLARSLDRKIIFHAGPTNSGKTYEAMQRLGEATSGYYLAPLRLLALEGYEGLKERGIPCSLITGEEEMIDEESAHISSTIEMLNLSVEVDVCVIDEIQMIDDRDRGWAWANALIGAPAKEVILTGSADALSAVSQIVAYLGETLEVVHFTRKNPLEMLPRATPLKSIEPKTAIIAFSRKEVLSYKQRLSERYRVSVVYGNLSPEVRREEARKFREGESDLLVATDAIAMGLNLPIKTILFARDNKFDGLRRRELTATEVLQISGRAGRYGIEEHGFVGALEPSALKTISDRFHTPLPDIELPFSVMASLDHVLLIAEILETEDLLEILAFFADNMEFDGPFVAANIEGMLEIAAIVGEYDLDLRAKYHLSCAPVGIRSPYIESVFRRYLALLEKGEAVPYIPPRDLPPYAHTNDELLNAEDRVKEVSLYLWLGFKFADQFIEREKAVDARTRLNRYIETSLQKGNFTKQCSRCGKALDFSYRYAICDACYSKGKRGERREPGGSGGYRGRKRRS